MRKSTGILLALLALASQALAQSNLESVLASVRKHNTTIAAARQANEAHALLDRTGLSPKDPFVTADYLIGRPRSGGNQVDITATQAFDFPTVYSRKSQLADAKAELHALELKRVEQAVLWEAKELTLHLIYLNKVQNLVETHAGEAREVLEDFEEKFAVEEIGALEVNRARIRYLGIAHELRAVRTEIATTTEQLIALNGGIALVVTDITYPEPGVLPSLEELQSMTEALDPELRIYRQEMLVSDQEVSVNKALAMPQLEAGYHFQSVLGQTFNGLHVGASIPLWERRNTVESAESLVEFQELKAADRRLQLQRQTARLYLEGESLRESLEQFRQALNGLTTKELLRMSLDLGEIDFITYIMEHTFYHESNAQLLEIEFEYHRTIAELLKSNI